MRCRHYLGVLGAVAMLLVSGVARAEPAQDPEIEAALAKLPPTVKVVSSDPTTWKQKNGEAESVSSVVDVEGMPFKQAFRVETKVRMDRDFKIQFGTLSTETVANGDILFLTFYARTIKAPVETGLGQVNFSFFTLSEPRIRVGRAEESITEEWKRYYVPWPVDAKGLKEPVPAGGLTLMLNLGVPPQIVEVADVQVLKYPPGVKPMDLPKMVQTYEGREPDAQWRKDAQARIEQIRKGDLAVEVVDVAGKPVENAQVRVQMTRHAFGFGAAYADPRVVELKSPDSQRYRAEFIKLFNCGVSESAMKWTEWVKNRERPMKAAKWMIERRIPIRGHNLIWPQWDRIEHLPKEQVELFRNDKTAMQKALLDHIRDELGAFKGMCYQWDLINEPMTHMDFVNHLGPEAMVEWFKVAHEVDPNTVLVPNETRFEYIRSLPKGELDVKHDFYDYLTYLRQNGAPMGGVGIESHHGGRVPSPIKLLKNYDKFAEFGPIFITEFDCVSPDEQLQGDFTRDFMIAAFSHPAVREFMMWGFWDGQHYRKNAPIFRMDWSIKPSGQAYMDLVFKQWWTDENLTTDASGKLKTRAFLGEYNIVVTRDGKTYTQPFDLHKGGGSVKVIADPSAPPIPQRPAIPGPEDKAPGATAERAKAAPEPAAAPVAIAAPTAGVFFKADFESDATAAGSKPWGEELNSHYNPGADVSTIKVLEQDAAGKNVKHYIQGSRLGLDGNKEDKFLRIVLPAKAEGEAKQGQAVVSCVFSPTGDANAGRLADVEVKLQLRGEGMIGLAYRESTGGATRQPIRLQFRADGSVVRVADKKGADGESSPSAFNPAAWQDVRLVAKLEAGTVDLFVGTNNVASYKLPAGVPGFDSFVITGGAGNPTANERIDVDDIVATPIGAAR